MGGSVSGPLTTKVTHLVAETIIKSPKYLSAMEKLCIPVLHSSFVIDCWNRSFLGSIDMDSLILQHKVPIFHGCLISTSGISIKCREEMEWTILKNGGRYCGDFSDSCTHLLIPPDLLRFTSKMRFAHKWQIPIVKTEWINRAMEKKYLVDDKPFRMTKIAMENEKVEYDYDDLTLKDIEVVERCTIDFPQYFSDCHIFIGDEAPSSRILLLKKLVIIAGGTRYSNYHGNPLTHYIIHNQVFPFSDFEDMKKQNIILPKVIHDTWLIGCFYARKKLLETPFQVDVEGKLGPVPKLLPLSFNSPSTPNTMTNMTMTTTVTAITSTITTGTKLTTINEREGNAISINGNNKNPINNPDSDTRSSLILFPPLNVFSEKVFYLDNSLNSNNEIIDENEQENNENDKISPLIKAIKNVGGKIAKDENEENIDFAIFPLVVSSPRTTRQEDQELTKFPFSNNNFPIDNTIINSNSSISIKNLLWLEMCLAQNVILTNKNHYFDCIQTCNLISLQSFNICSSGFVGLEKDYIKRLVIFLHGKCTDNFTMKNTHLLYREEEKDGIKTGILPKGPKYLKAQSWNIPCVPFSWLLNSIKNGIILPIKENQDFPLIPFLVTNEIEKNGNENDNQNRNDNQNENENQDPSLMEKSKEKELEMKSKIEIRNEKGKIEFKEKELNGNIPSSSQLSPIPPLNDPLTSTIEITKSINKTPSIKRKTDHIVIPIDTPIRMDFTKKLKELTENISSQSQNVDIVDYGLQRLFNGLTFAISPKIWLRREELHDLVVELGGQFIWTYDPTCTHYLHQGNQEMESFREFQIVKQHNKIIVSPWWIIKCKEESRKLEEKLFPHTFDPNNKLPICNYPPFTFSPFPSPLANLEGEGKKKEGEESSFLIKNSKSLNLISMVKPIEPIVCNYDLNLEENDENQRNEKNQMKNDLNEKKFDNENNENENNENCQSKSLKIKKESLNCHFIIALSGLEEGEKEEFLSFLKKIKVSTSASSNQWDQNTSHLILGNPSKSEKFLSACASGIWILKPSFLTDSQIQKKCLWGLEEQYEWQPSITDDESMKKLKRAPKRWRLHLESFTFIKENRNDCNFKQNHNSPSSPSPSTSSNTLLKRETREMVNRTIGAYSGWIVYLASDQKRMPSLIRILEAGKAEKIWTCLDNLDTIQINSLTHVLMSSKQISHKIPMEITRIAELKKILYPLEFMSDHLFKED